jgi:two-component system NtrC family response regulator
MARILFIDDDSGGRQMASFNLRKAGHEVDEADDGQVGLDMFGPNDHDLVITDVKMPQVSGIEVAKAIHDKAADVPVLVITAFGSVEVAVDAMKAGAFDFILKPFNKDQLILAVEKALRHRHLERENRELRLQLAGVERPIIHESSTMANSIAIADRVAETESSVLVTGESGTGKELIARRVHARSPRAEGPFVAVNCAAIPGELLESELFGHTKGAFTGAAHSRTGKFRQAEGGTLFLDEVAEIPLPVQGKLLRVIQEKVVDVLGSDKPRPVDVRIVAATNRDLHAAVRDGLFREDLYYRLNVVEIEVPPLRQRPEDIPALVRHFVQELAPGRDIKVTQAVLAALTRRSWPGNVRELRNACERMVILSPNDKLSVDVLPPQGSLKKGRAEKEIAGVPRWLDLPPEGFSLVDLEKQVIEQALAVKNGNISEAARYLQVPRHILVYRIDKYGIPRTPKL